MIMYDGNGLRTPAYRKHLLVSENFSIDLCCFCERPFVS